MTTTSDCRDAVLIYLGSCIHVLRFGFCATSMTPAFGDLQRPAHQHFSSSHYQGTADATILSAGAEEPIVGSFWWRSSALLSRHVVTTMHRQNNDSSLRHRSKGLSQCRRERCGWYELVEVSDRHVRLREVLHVGRADRFFVGTGSSCARIAHAAQQHPHVPWLILISDTQAGTSKLTQACPIRRPGLLQSLQCTLRADDPWRLVAAGFTTSVCSTPDACKTLHCTNSSDIATRDLAGCRQPVPERCMSSSGFEALDEISFLQAVNLFFTRRCTAATVHKHDAGTGRQLPAHQVPAVPCVRLH